MLVCVVACWTLLAIAAFGLPGCASNPVTAAQDSEQRAYAIYGTFVIVEEQGANVIGSATVPDAIKHAIKIADAKAKPSADALLQAVRDFDNASHDFKQGTNTASDLQIATTHLQQWVIQAQADVSALVTAVKQGN